MANRFLKSSIWTSPKLSAISNDAEVIYYRLIPLADDHGCFPADPRILKGLIAPFKNSITVDIICYQLITLCSKDLVRLWIGEDERIYGLFPNWRKHQQIRSIFKRKTPIPPEIYTKPEFNIDNDFQNNACKSLKDIVINLQQNVASLPSSLLPLPFSNQLQKKIKKKKVTIEKKTTSDHTLFTRWWCDEFLKKFDVKYPYDGKDAKQIEALLKNYPVDKLKLYAKLFWNSGDEFSLNGGFTIGIFKSKITAIALKEKGIDGKTKRLSWRERQGTNTESGSGIQKTTST